ncbi:reverse transcriptase domain-containing protein [Tanacetum coccineum]
MYERSHGCPKVDDDHQLNVEFKVAVVVTPSMADDIQREFTPPPEKERDLMVEEMVCHLRKEAKIEVLTQIRKRQYQRFRGGRLGGIHGSRRKVKKMSVKKIKMNIILFPYLEYGVLSLSGYGVLVFNPAWSLVSAGTDTPYLLDGYGVLKLYTNGASNKHGSEAGLIFVDPEGAEYSYALRLNFTNSNNDAEYEALLACLRILTKIKVEKRHAFVDSKLVANQVEGSYKAKGEKTKKYKEEVLEIIRSFSNFRISHIPREETKKADDLSKLAAVQCEGLTKRVLIEELNKGSVDMAEVNAIIEEATRAWMTPIQEYIKHGILPEDAVEA